jgi:hypothetical protein
MKFPRQSPLTRSPPLARSIKVVNDERVHDRGAEVESADGDAGVVQVQDKGGGVETRVPGQINEEDVDDQKIDDSGGDSHDVAVGVDEHANDDAGV